MKSSQEKRHKLLDRLERNYQKKLNSERSNKYARQLRQQFKKLRGVSVSHSRRSQDLFGIDYEFSR